jgi:hypothetical protein
MYCVACINHRDLLFLLTSPDLYYFLQHLVYKYLWLVPFNNNVIPSCKIVQHKWQEHWFYCLTALGVTQIEKCRKWTWVMNEAKETLKYAIRFQFQSQHTGGGLELWKASFKVAGIRMPRFELCNFQIWTHNLPRYSMSIIASHYCFNNRFNYEIFRSE